MPSDILSSNGNEEELHFNQESSRDGAPGPGNFPWSLNSEDSSLDSIAAMKKSKNREAAKKSRAKKKAESNMLNYSSDKVGKENNKLKLDNAALRAENQVLKRQLNYFENLFAKKTQT